MSPLETTIKLDSKFTKKEFEELVKIFFSTDIWTKFYPNTLETIHIKGSGFNVSDIILEKYIDNTGYYIFNFIVDSIEIGQNEANISWIGTCVKPHLDPKKFNCSLKYSLKYKSKSIYFTRTISIKHDIDNTTLDFNELLSSHYLFLDFVQKYSQFLLK